MVGDNLPPPLLINVSENLGKAAALGTLPLITPLLFLLEMYDLKHQTVLVKDQLISKGLIVILNSSQKQKKKIQQTTMIPKVLLFVFWENLKTPNRHLEII